MGIPAAVLANFERFVATTFDKVGEIHRPTRTPNDEGGTATVWAPVATGVAFSVSEGFGGQSNLEGPILDRIGSRAAFFLTFAAGFDIDEDDRVYQTLPTARTFEVVGIPNKGATYQAATRVVAVERS